MATTNTTGLRELRQRASDLVRRAEAGETIIVTVSGREVAQLGPVQRNRWRSSADVSAALADAGHIDLAEWEADMARIDQTIRDPWNE